LTDVEADVRGALQSCDVIHSIDLVGSRGRGDATSVSDWDFKITTSDFRSASAEVPRSLASLCPLGALWDPLSETWCYMLILDGPVKVDLIFDEPHAARSPWTVDDAHGDVDDHFWDWVWWLAAKDQRGRSDLVASELEKLHWFLLGPIGARPAPDTAGAVAAYRAVRPNDSALATHVCAGLHRLGYDVPL
jgi:hypothetical protein